MVPREILRKVRQLEIRTKGIVSNLFGGEYHSAFKGRGMEFVEVRPYQFGDDIRTIDWNVSARSGDETYVKVFQEEREQTLMLAVDISGSGLFGSRYMFKKDLAAEVCAVLAFSAIQNNDKVGLLLFSDRVELFVPPKKGRRHVLRIIRDLYAFQPISNQTNIAIALEHLLHTLRRRSIVLILSDFLNEGYDRPLRILGRRHDTVAIRISDKREEQLPALGLLQVTDTETGETLVCDTKSKDFQKRLWTFVRNRDTAYAERFRKMQVDLIALQTDESYIEPLSRYFRERHRRR
ncbi:MAG: DUF58 domain-containing protein [Bacteroidetes Order II. Incertae sedis bacterium]|nr:DUF58 domain-containing protein [Bacteroidetes Order II. bacterium]